MDSVIFTQPENITDQNLPWINPKIEIRRSLISGWGVFAKETLEADELLERCVLVPLPTDVNQNDPLLENYRFGWPAGKKWEKYVLALGWASLYNHSEHPNANWFGCGDQYLFDFRSLSRIEKGQEIYVSYGQSYTYHWK